VQTGRTFFSAEDYTKKKFIIIVVVLDQSTVTFQNELNGQPLHINHHIKYEN
jgi:hypothetical protein